MRKPRRDGHTKEKTILDLARNYFLSSRLYILHTNYNIIPFETISKKFHFYNTNIQSIDNHGYIIYK